MTRHTLAIALIPIIALAGCGAVTPSAATQLGIAKTDYAFEVSYSLAAQTYIAAEPVLNKPANAAIKAQVKGLLLQMLNCPTPTTCTGYLVLARKAAAISDSSSLASEVAQITSLAGQVTTLVTSAR